MSGAKKGSKQHRYTSEQLEFIQSVAQGNTREEIKDLFNDRFNANVTTRAIGSLMSRHGIKNNMQGYATRFNKGQVAWNKDKKGLQLGGEAGWFKKGHIPSTHKPVGSEIVEQQCVWIKVAEPNAWERKHRYIWEQAYGKIPEGHVILFKDGDKSNVVLENLFMVTHSVSTSIAKRGLRQADPELNVTIHNVAQLDLAVRHAEQSLTENTERR